ncbi:3-isopropylmalate dehydrogenase [Batrachochytrium salamandrivorans]|nr:3-isopropylmalate dehydrogenase [Batrachochytrium salamandrivorans]
MLKKIALLPGDGIGPEVMLEAVKVLTQVERLFPKSLAFQFSEGFVGGAGYDKYKNHFGAEAKQVCQDSDAVLFGSVGGPVNDQESPKWKDCEKNSILGLRKEFGFGVNVRPARIFAGMDTLSPLKQSTVAAGVDMVFIRELLGGVYFGEHTTSADGKSARDVMDYDEKQIELPMKFAFDLARTRKRRVTVVDKANVLDCSRLWRRVANRVAQDYPDVTLEFALVDNCAMQLVKNPTTFDVICTENLFGDVLSDIGSVLPGSLGLMPSASLGNKGKHMYEPAGGSAPDLTGKNVANPIAQILCCAMMLRFSFQKEVEAKLIEDSVESVLKQGHLTRDLILPGSDKQPVSTSRMGDLIAREMEKLARKQ